jgi:hypothetical protein
MASQFAAQLRHFFFRIIHFLGKPSILGRRGALEAPRLQLQAQPRIVRYEHYVCASLLPELQGTGDELIVRHHLR